MAKVKFSRGTQSNYDNLQTKDPDTVYIRTDSGNMYLGSKQLSDPSAVKSVQVGTTTTGAAGTNASVTNSGTSQEPVLNFIIPRGANGQDGQDGVDAINPFKGWYTSSSNLPANPVVGDYAYVKGATASDPAAIYECTTAGSWSDSGRTADTSNVQTFASGEEVNEVHIVDDLLTGGVHDVLNAEQGKLLGEAIFYGKTEYIEQSLELIQDKSYTTYGDPITGGLSGNNGCYCVRINCSAGEIFKIYGKGGNAYVRLYCVTKSDKSVLVRPTSAIDTRTDGEEIVCPENAAYLYINFVGYDSTTDRLDKLTIVHDGIVKRLEELEENALTEEDIADLNDSVTDFIKYRVNSYKEDLSIGVTYTTNKVINPSTGLPEDYNNSLQKVSDYISVEPKYLYEYHGGTIIANKANYAIYDSSQNLISAGLSTNSKVTQKICLPQNAAYIRLSYYNKKIDDYFIKYIPFEDTKDLILSPKSVKLGFDKTVLAYWDSTNDILTPSEAIDSSGTVISNTTSTSHVSDLITIEEGAIYKYRGISSSTAYLRVAYYKDAEGTQFISGEKQPNSTDVGEFVLDIPTGAVTFRCSFYNFYNIKYKQYLYKYIPKKEAVNLIELDKRDEEIAQINKINHWKGKIMCAFGASGTYGATEVSFPVEVGKILDCTVRNFAKSSPMRYYDNSLKTSGDYQGKSVGLSSTIAEWESEGYSGASIRSWEKYFTSDLDLVIFGEGDSNCPVGDELIDLVQLPTQSNKHYTYSNGDTLEEHRDSYIGALVYLLDKLWGINPACRVVFTNDYLSIDNYSNASGLRNRTKALCEKLCLPNIQIWQKLGWSWYNQHIYMSHTSNPADTVHPNELGTLKVAQIYANELLLIS